MIVADHWSKFCIVDRQFNIKLTGVPDDIFIMADGRYFIIDYKTARFTDNQDKLLGMYRVQLNGYAHIFEKLGMGTIGGLGLCYYEPQGDASTVKLFTVLRQDGFVMPFKAHLKKIELDAEGVVRPLLKEVRRYADMGGQLLGVGMGVGIVGCWGWWLGWWGRSILTFNHRVMKCNWSLHGG